MTDTLKNFKHKKWITAALAVVLLTIVGFIAFGGSATNRAEVAASHEHSPGEQAATDSMSQTDVARGGLAAYDKNGDGIVYQGGMHPNIVQDEPGQCPICGMDLMPVSVDGMEEGTVKIDPVTLQNVGVRTASVVTMPLGARER